MSSLGDAVGICGILSVFGMKSGSAMKPLLFAHDIALAYFGMAAIFEVGICKFRSRVKGFNNADTLSRHLHSHTLECGDNLGKLPICKCVAHAVLTVMNGAHMKIVFFDLFIRWLLCRISDSDEVAIIKAL